MSMATTALHDICSGDVIELGVGDEAVTALVLLVSDDSRVILDRCDGTLPTVHDASELGPFRVFRPEHVATVAA